MPRVLCVISSSGRDGIPRSGLSRRLVSLLGVGLLWHLVGLLFCFLSLTLSFSILVTSLMLLTQTQVAVQLALNDISPSHATLGTLNGIALTLMSGLRAVAPALFSSIFATGVRYQIFAGYLVWVVLVLLALAQIVGLRWLPARAEGLVKSGAETDEVVENERERDNVARAEAMAAGEDVIE